MDAGKRVLGARLDDGCMVAQAIDHFFRGLAGAWDDRLKQKARSTPIRKLFPQPSKDWSGIHVVL